MVKFYDAIIIGGGASGMMAAITAKRRGKNVLLLEKNAKLGRKILITGNGRCNITNENSIEDEKNVIHYHGENPKFIFSVLNQFGIYNTKDFFSDLGIEFIEEDNGRLFPSSNQAQSVVDVLTYELKRLNVKIVESNIPKKITFDSSENLYRVIITDGRELLTKKLVIATGGKTYPKTGSTGDGYLIAQQFGHKLINQFPIYTPVNVKSPLCQKLQGVKLEVEVKIISDGKVVATNTGTIMFAHFGLSAPVILELSRIIAKKIVDREITLRINFLPNLDINEIEKYIVNRWAKSPLKSLGFSFIGLLPQKVFPAILDVNNIDKEIKVSEVNRELRTKIIELLTKYEFRVESIRGFEEAHFTAGGVNTKEINPQTLESKIQRNLYFCGEVLDIDGDCGGYNLQWAWSSGAVVGKYL